MTNSFLSSKSVCGQFCEYGETKYPKFIPIYEKKESYRLPKSKIFKAAPKCCFDLQIWHIDYVDEKLFRKEKRVKTSQSDSSVVVGKKDICQHNCKVKEVNYDGTSRKALVTDKRFGTSNIKFLTNGSSAVCDESKVSVQFYIKITKEQQSMLNLCHMKTEMIVSCLQIFFKPYNRTTVLWVNDLSSHIDKARERNKKNIFNEPVNVNHANVRAILYLDKNAAKLIRHKNLCFFDTLITVVEINTDDLLVLPMSTLYSDQIHGSP